MTGTVIVPMTATKDLIGTYGTCDSLDISDGSDEEKRVHNDIRYSPNNHLQYPRSQSHHRNRSANRSARSAFLRGEGARRNSIRAECIEPQRIQSGPHRSFWEARHVSHSMSDHTRRQLQLCSHDLTGPSYAPESNNAC